MTWRLPELPQGQGPALQFVGFLSSDSEPSLLGALELESYMSIPLSTPWRDTNTTQITMHISGAINLFAALLCATSALAAATADSIRTTDVFAWPSTASSPLPFARVSYSWPALNATVDSYTAPAVKSEETVRVGVHRAGDWVGVATSGYNFDATKKPTLRLLVDSNGDVWHVGFSAAATGGKSTDGSLAVEVVPLRQGPQVAFDKPIVVNQQGEPETKEPEKSFLQKYVS